jgi:hypothetical protein
MILGGLIGFLIGISFGVAQGSAWPAVIWRASVATFLAGVLLRWWGRVWIRSLRQAQLERLALEDQKAALPAGAKGKG